MTDVREDNWEPFTGGPYARMLSALGLPPPPAPRVARRIAAVITLTWLPLVALAALQGHAYHYGEPKDSLLLDAAVHARYLLTAPLLVVAESFCLPVMAHIVRQFAERGLIADEDRERYKNLLESTGRLLNGRTTEIILVVLVAAQAWLAARTVAPQFMADSWRGHTAGGATFLTYAGWWNALVSYPLYLFLLYGWLWRLFLWGRCLFTLSRLNLRLQPSHPDRVGGLGFVSVALTVLPLLAFALACVPAGGIADRILFAGKDVADYKGEVIAFAVLVVALLAGPLLFFSQPLRRARTAGIFRYSLLAALAARREELTAGTGDETQNAAAEPNDDGADFSAISARYTNAKQMQILPFDTKSIAGIVVGVILPFVPVLMIQVPLKDILEKLKALIF